MAKTKKTKRPAGTKVIKIKVGTKKASVTSKMKVAKKKIASLLKGTKTKKATISVATLKDGK